MKEYYGLDGKINNLYKFDIIENLKSLRVLLEILEIWDM